jgi:hypothetical protein
MVGDVVSAATNAVTGRVLPDTSAARVTVVAFSASAWRLEGTVSHQNFEEA